MPTRAIGAGAAGPRAARATPGMPPQRGIPAGAKWLGIMAGRGVP
jgi:hypothetical protein